MEKFYIFDPAVSEMCVFEHLIITEWCIFWFVD